jgi:hypothetical protein
MGQHTERSGLLGKRFHYGTELVSLVTNSSAGSTAVTFKSAYTGVPQALIISPRGAAGNYSAGSVSAGGFTVRVTGETDTDYKGKTQRLVFFCHER